MNPTKLGRSLIGVLCFSAAIALPTLAAAQTITTQTPFEILPMPVNPCTGNNTVDVTGVETTTMTTKVTGSGQLHLDISDVFKGTGVDVIDATKTYTFSDNQQFSFNVVIPADPNGTTDSTFTDKFFMKGSKALDNWTVKATITFRVNANGIVTKDVMFTSDVCKG